MFHSKPPTIPRWLTAIPLLVMAGHSNASPIGLWDIHGKSRASIVQSGASIEGTPQVYYHQAQFGLTEFATSQGMSFMTAEALNVVAGWKQTGNTLNIAYKLDDLNGTASSGTPADFLLYLQNQFANLALSGKLLAQPPTQVTATLTAQHETATLGSNSLTLKGRSQIVAAISYHDAADTAHPDALTTAELTLSSDYNGTRMMMPSACCSADKSDNQNLVDSLNFMLFNKRIPGVKTTPSGLEYKVLAPGYGPKPRAADQVHAWYRAMLPNGLVFEGNRITFTLADIASTPGLAQGLKRMPEGAWYRFYIPPKLGYQGTEADAIPPNSAIVFDVKLLNVSR